MPDKTAEDLLRELVVKLGIIFTSDDYLGVFTSAFVHGVKYEGQTCEEEIKAAKKFLGIPF